MALYKEFSESEVVLFKQIVMPGIYSLNMFCGPRKKKINLHGFEKVLTV